MNIEVILSAYNDAQGVKVVLDGYLSQSDSNFPLCVADDGSGSENETLVQKYKIQGLNIRHVWQADKGFRKAKILNKAIFSSAADWIIFSDSDCIPDKHFIRDHRDAAKEGRLVIGPRAFLEERISTHMRAGRLSHRFINYKLTLFCLSFIKQVKNIEQVICYPNGVLPFVRLLKKRLLAIGANTATSRQALLKINGLDERFSGWGGKTLILLNVWLKLESFVLVVLVVAAFFTFNMLLEEPL